MSFDAQVGDSRANAADVDFTLSAVGADNINGYGLFDAATGGNLIAFVVVSPTIAVSVGDIVRFTVGNTIATAS